MNPQNQQPVQPVQPASPSSDFLSRMDAVEHPVAPEPEKKKMSKGMLIGIIVGAVAVVGIIVAVVIMLVSNNNQATPTETNYPEYPEEPEIDEEAAARNKLRVKDLVPLSDAVKLYQAEDEAEGQLPGADNDEWYSVISRYVPAGKIVDGATGEEYKMGAVCKFGESCVDISALTWENNNHEIYALYNADCKGNTKENVIVSSTRLRRVAIFAIVENGEFICTTN